MTVFGSTVIRLSITQLATATPSALLRTSVER